MSVDAAFIGCAYSGKTWILRQMRSIIVTLNQILLRKMNTVMFVISF